MVTTIYGRKQVKGIFQMPWNQKICPEWWMKSHGDLLKKGRKAIIVLLCLAGFARSFAIGMIALDEWDLHQQWTMG